MQGEHYSIDFNLSLPYWKQGEDIEDAISHSKNVAGGLTYHATQMKLAHDICTLAARISMLATLQVCGQTHTTAIYVRTTTAHLPPIWENHSSQC